MNAREILYHLSYIPVPTFYVCHKSDTLVGNSDFLEQFRKYKVEIYSILHSTENTPKSNANGTENETKCAIMFLLIANLGLIKSEFLKSYLC